MPRSAVNRVLVRVVLLVIASSLIGACGGGNGDADLEKEITAISETGEWAQLRPYFTHASPRIREWAVIQVGLGKGDVLAAELLDTLVDSNTNVRMASVIALSQLGAKFTDVFTVRLGLEESRAIRVQMIKALGYDGNTNAVPTLLSRLGLDAEGVFVARALGEIGDKRAIPELKSLLAAPGGASTAEAKSIKEQSRLALKKLAKS